MRHWDTTRIIEEFIAANYSEAGGARQQYALRQVLHGLVRQAKAEQLAEIRLHATRLAGLEAAAPRAPTWPRPAAPGRHELECDEGEAGE